MYIGNGSHLFHGILCEHTFVGVNVVNAQRVNVVECRGQSVATYIVRCASLKLKGKALVGSLLKRDAGYHLAAALIRWQLFE